MNTDLFGLVYAAVWTLLNQYSAVFAVLGQQLFRAFALINIVWFGLMCALSAAEGHGGIEFGRFAKLVLRLSIGFALTTYYNVPIPGLGVSFVHLITDHGQALVNRLSVDTIQQLQQQLTTLETNFAIPTIWEPSSLITAIVLLPLLWLAEACVFTVISFGYIAMAICVLLGPTFIPFFIVPELEWVFSGWLRCFWGYSFYPVVASAYVYVFGDVLIKVLNSPLFLGGISVLNAGPLAVVLIGFTYGMFKIPSLVDGLFSGHAGDYALPNLGPLLRRM